MTVALCLCMLMHGINNTEGRFPSSLALSHISYCKPVVCKGTFLHRLKPVWTTETCESHLDQHRGLALPFAASWNGYIHGQLCLTSPRSSSRSPKCTLSVIIANHCGPGESPCGSSPVVSLPVLSATEPELPQTAMWPHANQQQWGQSRYCNSLLNVTLDFHKG